MLICFQSIMIFCQISFRAMESNNTANKKQLTKRSYYQSLSLMELVERVVQHEDPDALDEILNRPLFHSQEKSRLRLSEYLETQRMLVPNILWGRANTYEIADKAYDSAMDKFFNLHVKFAGSRHNLQPINTIMKQTGPDCRLYWKAFLKYLTKEFKKRPPASKIDEESKASALIQRFVKRHFFLSLLEAQRSTDKFWSRYNWQLGNHSICVWLPKFLKGTQRRRWLEKNIKDPDPTSSAERKRIQKVIRSKLGTMAFVRYQEDIGLSSAVSTENQLSSSTDFGITLGRFIAEEKSGDIDNQRRSIRKLGKEKLEMLVIRIFEDLDAGTFKDQQIAKDFGLSKATFSRFAGSRWHASATAAIPDLWQNTAHVLSTHPEFKEATIAAGVWKKVEQTIENKTCK